MHTVNYRTTMMQTDLYNHVGTDQLSLTECHGHCTCQSSLPDASWKDERQAYSELHYYNNADKQLLYKRVYGIYQIVCGKSKGQKR